MEEENTAMQYEIAAMSTRGKQRVVPGAGHVVHADKPEAVVDAVLEVLMQVKQIKSMQPIRGKELVR